VSLKRQRESHEYVIERLKKKRETVRKDVHSNATVSVPYALYVDLALDDEAAWERIEVPASLNVTERRALLHDECVCNDYCRYMLRTRELNTLKALYRMSSDRADQEPSWTLCDDCWSCCARNTIRSGENCMAAAFAGTEIPIKLARYSEESWNTIGEHFLETIPECEHDALYEPDLDGDFVNSDDDDDSCADTVIVASSPPPQPDSSPC
jgi:hypothetical protein